MVGTAAGSIANKNSPAFHNAEEKINLLSNIYELYIFTCT